MSSFVLFQLFRIWEEDPTTQIKKKKKKNVEEAQQHVLQVMVLFHELCFPRNLKRWPSIKIIRVTNSGFLRYM